MDEQLARQARERAGVLARRDAIASGMSYDAYNGLVSRGLYVPNGAAAIRAVTTPESFTTRLWAGALEVGSEVFITGAAGAVLLGIGRVAEPDVIEAMVATTRRPPKIPGWRLIRAMPGDLLGARQVAGHLVSGREVTLRQLARRLAYGRMVTVVQDELRRRTTTAHRLLSVTGRGREGSSALRRALLVPGDGAHARGERRLAAAVRRRGVPLETQVNIRTADGASYWLDGLVRAARLGYGIEGPEHLDPDQHDYDCRRANRVLVSEQIDLMRFAASRVDRDVETVADEFAAACFARRPMAS